MQLRKVSARLSKEEVHLADEHGNFTHTWARLELEAELEEGDDPQEVMRHLRGLLQPEVDDWLQYQGGYIPPVEPEPAEDYQELEEKVDASSDDIPD